ncbi:YcbK family protein [Desulfosarcina sp.]|uniref:YcbK family protein n=1 Tax=Desulfosarcina sp. TaxID=2027861 RepID=UPI003970F690
MQQAAGSPYRKGRNRFAVRLSTPYQGVDKRLASTAQIDRRTFLKMGASVILTTAFAHPALAALSPEHHVLSFYNVHTGETLKTCYRANGKLIHRAVIRINHIMRDFRTGEIKAIDPNLLDLLHHIVVGVKPVAPISIISGYRSPSTNAALRKVSGGVAKKSLHMEGRAVDIRIPGHQTPALRQVAIDLQSGGVGYYPKSNFVHLDTGPIKIW